MRRMEVASQSAGNRACHGPNSGLAPVPSGSGAVNPRGMKRAFAIALAATLLAGCGGAAQPKRVPNVRGYRLDVAEARLDARGLGWEEVGGGTFGVVVRSHWYVLEQVPAPGRKATTVRLVVERCDDD